MSFILFQPCEKCFEISEMRTFIPDRDKSDFWDTQVSGSDSGETTTLFKEIPVGCFKFKKEIINYAE